MIWRSNDNIVLSYITQTVKDNIQVFANGGTNQISVAYQANHTNGHFHAIRYKEVEGQ